MTPAKRGFAWAAVVAASIAVAACSDDAVAPHASGYTTTSELRVLNPATRQLELVAPARPLGISASVAVSSETPALFMKDGNPNISKGSARYVTSYIDKNGKKNVIEEFWPSTGGPVGSHYHLVDGKVIAITAFSWKRVPGGYYLAKAEMRLVDPKGASLATATVVSTYTQETTPCNPKVTSCPPGQTVMLTPSQRWVKFAFTAATCAAGPALAQTQGGFYFAQCAGEWLVYAAAMAALYVAAGTYPEGGWAGAGAAMGAAAYALHELVACMNRSTTSASPLFGSGGGATGGGGGGGNYDDCSSGGSACPVLTYSV